MTVKYSHFNRKNCFYKTRTRRHFYFFICCLGNIYLMNCIKGDRIKQLRIYNNIFIFLKEIECRIIFVALDFCSSKL